MQYTIHDVPPNLDAALRRRAREERKSLNEVALEALAKVFGLTRPAVKKRDLTGQAIKQRDLRDVAGSWKRDDAVMAALEDQRRVDPELWR